MKALIFAAGLGTRLKPITDHTPKALVKVAGKPLLQRTLEHVKKYNFNEVIVNVHHLAEQVVGFLENYYDPELKISISDEREELLDTGGGLKKAEWFLKSDRPFLVINADVVSDLDLSRVMQYHERQKALATLVVRARNSSRCFLFDDNRQLCGWENKKTGQKILTRTDAGLHGLPFSGIHIIDPLIFELMKENGKFSIVDVYMRLSAQHKIVGFSDEDSLWFDVGDADKLKKANEELD